MTHLAQIPPALNPLHMGALHPVETMLVLLLAFGPFVVLIALIYVRRRRNGPDTDPAADQSSNPRHRRGGDGPHERNVE